MTHAVMQGRRAKRLATLGMDDFAGLFTGLPIQRGTEQVEETTKELIQAITGMTVVGVSVCWDFREKKDEVAKILDNDICALTDSANGGRRRNANPFRDVPACFKAVDSLVGFDGLPPEKQEDEDVAALLCSLTTSGTAFAIFDSPVARDEAVAAASESPDAGTIRAYNNTWEADTVIWENFSREQTNL